MWPNRRRRRTSSYRHLSKRFVRLQNPRVVNVWRKKVVKRGRRRTRCSARDRFLHASVRLFGRRPLPQQIRRTPSAGVPSHRLRYPMTRVTTGAPRARLPGVDAGGAGRYGRCQKRPEGRIARAYPCRHAGYRHGCRPSSERQFTASDNLPCPLAHKWGAHEPMLGQSAAVQTFRRPTGILAPTEKTQLRLPVVESTRNLGRTD